MKKSLCIVLSLVGLYVIFFISVAEAKEYINEEYGFQLEYPSSWEVNNKIQSAVSPEVAKMFNKDINPDVYPEFTQFRILQLKPDIESDGYESSFVGNPVFSLSIYPNVSSLEDIKEKYLSYIIFSNKATNFDKAIEAVELREINNQTVYFIQTKEENLLYDGEIYSFTDLFLNKNTGYSLTYHTGSQLGHVYSDEIKKILNSFQFLN